MGKQYAIIGGAGREVQQKFGIVGGASREIKNEFAIINGISRNIFVREKYVWGSPGGATNTWGVSANNGAVQHTDFEAYNTRAIDTTGFNTLNITWWGGNHGYDVNGDYSAYGGQVRRRAVCYVGTTNGASNLSWQAPARSTSDNFTVRTFSVNVATYGTVYVSLAIDVAGGGISGACYVRNGWLT